MRRAALALCLLIGTAFGADRTAFQDTAGFVQRRTSGDVTASVAKTFIYTIGGLLVPIVVVTVGTTDATTTAFRLSLTTDEGGTPFTYTRTVPRFSDGPTIETFFDMENASRLTVEKIAPVADFQIAVR